MTEKPIKPFEKKISKMSFEDAMMRLEEIVEILSSQKINLDSMIELHEEGTALDTSLRCRSAERSAVIT